MKISHLCHCLIYLFVVATLLGCSMEQQQPAHENAMLDKPVLRVGTVYGRQTYYIGPNGPRGFEYELAKGFADYLQVKLEILPFFSYQELQNQLDIGNIDIIATGSGRPTLSSEHRWGPTYQKVNHELVFLQGRSRPRTMADLSAPITLVEAANHVQSILKVSDNAAIETVQNRDSEELLVSVANGELAYTVADSNELNILRRRYPQLSVGFTLAKALPVAWQLTAKEDDALQGVLFEYIALIRANGRMAQLEDKYFGHVKQFNFVDTKAFIQAAQTELPQFVTWFKQAAGDIDWRLLAAMSYQESHWDPKAKSVTGVRGLMMLTLATAKDWGVSSRLDPQQSIAGGARYFASLSQRIPARISSPDRLWMALAAYNIGLGHLEDARVLTQRQGGDPDIWIDVKKRLPQLQQKRYYSQTRYGYARGNEALDYVENIRRYYDTLVWLDDNLSL